MSPRRARRQSFPSALILLAILIVKFAPAVGQTANPSAPEPLKIDAVTGFIHLLSKPELAYPKEALQQHIEGKVKLELTVSPQGDVVSERVVWGPSELQQATMDAFEKVKYIPFLRDGQPSVALVQAIVAYEKDHAVMSTEGGVATAIKRDDFGLGTGAHGRQMGQHDVKINWYNAIPKLAQMKHGNLVIEFAITKDGKVAGMKLVAPSGDVPLDRAAWAGLFVKQATEPIATGAMRPGWVAFSFSDEMEELLNKPVMDLSFEDITGEEHHFKQPVNTENNASGPPLYYQGFQFQKGGDSQHSK